MKIMCTTLFDITKTGVSSRPDRGGITDQNYNILRSKQSNFETILQLISLRCQPEEITNPEMSHKITSVFGEKYCGENIKTWSFTFTIDKQGVFEYGGDNLGALKNDCNGVPMIIGLDESVLGYKTLKTDPGNCNIFFKEITS